MADGAAADAYAAEPTGGGNRCDFSASRQRIAPLVRLGDRA
jgi:hypothetical protein